MHNRGLDSPPAVRPKLQTVLFLALQAQNKRIDTVLHDLHLLLTAHTTYPVAVIQDEAF